MASLDSPSGPPSGWSRGHNRRAGDVVGPSVPLPPELAPLGACGFRRHCGLKAVGMLRAVSTEIFICLHTGSTQEVIFNHGW